MQKLREIFGNLFSRRPPPEDRAIIEELRVAFRERYHNFKLLLSANNRSLELMADMERALQGDRPFGMPFIRSGAADIDRRLKRVNFIKDILWEANFRVETQEDHLVSRIENHDMACMEKRLEVPGYLTLHTRQLDGIMTRPASVAYYSRKLREDIQTLMTTPH